ncbi:MAG: ATP-dependent DNA helicase [Planctomycetota bacterium]|nr:MAG: ATP-dependent DNA helicase [Planctomycetota bacterium]
MGGSMALEGFHPAVRAWFARRFGTPTAPQAEGWPAIRAGRDTLIAAPTGSGKTLAALLAAIDELVQRGLEGELADRTHVVYVSPLKALSNDVERNLRAPFAGIRRELRRAGLEPPPLRVLVRTGDTPAHVRAAMVRRPPHICVTTPETLYLLLGSAGGRRMLAGVQVVIVDEIHALAATRRGAHLALSLERLQALVAQSGGAGPVRIGLSATQRPIEQVARLLVGAGRELPRIVDLGHLRRLDLGLEVPPSPLEAVMASEVWDEVYDRLAELIRAHRTTLVFANTRRLVERVSRHLAERLGAEQVCAHHGSLAREQRLQAEQRLKAGALRAIVATASLELGIDVGEVELVCQLGSPRAIGTWLQRAGRSGHSLGRLPKGRLFPLSRDELVECAALLDAVRCGELEELRIPEAPLDILAQQIVAEVAAAGEWDEDELFRLCRRAWPYRALGRADFEAVVHMLATGFTTRRGRRGAHVHRDAVHGRLRPRRGARLIALTCGGAIPDSASYDVVLEPDGTVIGTLDEDFAVESAVGDVFQLGNASWRVLKVERGRVRVEDARGAPPNLPFWLGEAPGRSAELSRAVGRLRARLQSWFEAGPGGARQACSWLRQELGLPAAAAQQLVDYLEAAQAALGVLPSQQTIVAERFFDEAGGMQLVIHAPFGTRLNRAWGLALRKRFCRAFNFELQAAATDDAMVLSLGPTHSFALPEVFRLLHSATVRELLVQAVLDAPLFAVRWRWNAARALAIQRWRGGRKVPPHLLRMEAEDLLALVFPDQLACLENIAGDREIPDHPLVRQTIQDCLREAMDIEGLEQLLRRLEAGEVRAVARELREPSPLAAEVLAARPYAYLDDAPLEERRARAVQSRRWLLPEVAADLGALDQAAIERVRREAWPLVRDAEELHDALVLLGVLTEAEGRAGEPEPGRWERWLEELAAARRATVVSAAPDGEGAPAPGAAPLRLWVAAERLAEVLAVHPRARLEPMIAPAPPGGGAGGGAGQPEQALCELVRSRLEVSGPVCAAELAGSLGVPVQAVERALVALEAEGFCLRGRFRPGASQTEWCERRLLARIHRATLERLHAEIEPVPAAAFMRFLFLWQHLGAARRLAGPEGLEAVLAQLEGCEVPAAAWEEEVLPARLREYDPLWLDGLCLSGRLLWARLSAPAETEAGRAGRARGPTSVRTCPMALLPRRALAAWRILCGPIPPAGVALSEEARRVLAYLRAAGPSFFAAIAEALELLPSRLEAVLRELVAAGLVGADGFAGLRALLVSARQRARPARRRRRREGALASMDSAGRWAAHPLGETGGDGQAGASPGRLASLEVAARALLRRYGVVTRRLVVRERWQVRWRELLGVYRRLEARGEIRGGRFVAAMAGEQFALPEAVGLLRRARRAEPAGELLAISAADPLNLTGIVTPGERVPAIATHRILYRDGEPIALWDGHSVRPLVPLDEASARLAHRALVQDRAPAAARRPAVAEG